MFEILAYLNQRLQVRSLPKYVNRFNQTSNTLEKTFTFTNSALFSGTKVSNCYNNCSFHFAGVVLISCPMAVCFIRYIGASAAGTSLITSSNLFPILSFKNSNPKFKVYNLAFKSFKSIPRKLLI